MNTTTNNLEWTLEGLVTVPAYIFAILGGVIFLLVITLTCTCCCNDIVCCHSRRNDVPHPQPLIIGAAPESKLVLRSREIVRRGTGV